MYTSFASRAKYPQRDFDCKFNVAQRTAYNKLLPCASDLASYAQMRTVCRPLKCGTMPPVPPHLCITFVSPQKTYHLFSRVLCGGSTCRYPRINGTYSKDRHGKSLSMHRLIGPCRGADHDCCCWAFAGLSCVGFTSSCAGMLVAVLWLGLTDSLRVGLPNRDGIGTLSYACTPEKAVLLQKSDPDQVSPSCSARMASSAARPNQSTAPGLNKTQGSRNALNESSILVRLMIRCRSNLARDAGRFRHSS